MTPAVMDKPDVSSPLFRSTEGADGLCEYLEDRDPLALVEPLGTSSIGPPSSCRESDDFSLCNFRPKKDLPPEDCLDLLSTGGVVDGIAHRMILWVNARSVVARLPQSLVTLVLFFLWIRKGQATTLEVMIKGIS